MLGIECHCLLQYLAGVGQLTGLVQLLAFAHETLRLTAWSPAVTGSR